MSGLGRSGAGLLTALLVLACTGTQAADHASDSPESRLRARISDLRADVELLKVECAAARHNLLECLKKSGKLELEDRKPALLEIKDQIRTVKIAGQAAPFANSAEVAKKITDDAEKTGTKQDKEQSRLLIDLLKGGAEGEKALDRMAEIEYQGRVDSVRAEAERRKTDFLRKVRSLNQKKMELAEAEAEYKSSR